MTNILLISEDYVKSNSNIDDNLWGKFLLPAIREAQEMGLQSIIGGNLYDTITSMVADNTIQDDDNFDYKYLLDKHIQPYLLYQVMTDVIPLIGTKISNLGLMRTDDDKSYNVDKTERDDLKTYYQYRADFYTRRMQEYLCKNRILYPELSDCDCDKMKTNLDSSATCNIWLGGERGYGYNNGYIGK